MNSATFAGRLGQDATLRRTGQGDAVLSFSVAVDERRGGQKTTLWVSCALWGKRAEALEQYLTKGTVVCVTGRVAVRTYETRDGKGGVSLDLNVQEVTLLGGGDRQPQQREPDRRAAERDHAATAGEGDFDDDIPF